ncbi:9056_t:CDS:2 [Cetraspora pellucida]|uniref:9056_t:CDS:1 n=1 Tax=Cetraspora pellucida TaxID=1433469 RepID=A0A9N9NBK6_9GLOM|nr:9056_t:CDS:2 [Cetraspora pellucida]
MAAACPCVSELGCSIYVRHCYMKIKVSGRDITKGTLRAINVVANATPFGSLISGITELISEITQIYEAAHCNKKICNALLI